MENGPSTIAGCDSGTSSSADARSLTSRRCTSIAVRRAMVASHGARSRPGSTVAADRHAFTKVCCAASSASSLDPSRLRHTAKTSRPYSR